MRIFIRIVGAFFALAIILYRSWDYGEIEPDELAMCYAANGDLWPHLIVLVDKTESSKYLEMFKDRYEDIIADTTVNTNII